METLSSVFYFLIVIGILVNIHEFGHFIAARLSGMRVDVFSFGMGKRLFGYNSKQGFTFGDLDEEYEHDGITDYRFSLLPIGGYVKIAGMVDESMDSEFEKTPPQPWEFRSKNAFLKAFVLSAGVIMNFLLAVVIYTSTMYISGETVMNTNEIGYVSKNSVAEAVGLKSGDKIAQIGENKITNWTDLVVGLTLNNSKGEQKVVVNRNGETIDIQLKDGKVLKELSEKKPLGIDLPQQTIYFRDVLSLKAAGSAGLKPEDTILTVNNQKIISKLQLTDLIAEYKGTPMNFVFNRNGKVDSLSVTTDKDGLLGVYIEGKFNGQILNKNFGIIESLTYGFNNSVNTIGMIVSSIRQIFIGNVDAGQAIGGPIMIAKSSAQTAELGLSAFSKFVAALSLSLALMNILPFPALDGGHLVIVLIEAIIRRELPLKAKMVIQQFGVVVLLILMLVILYLDLSR